MLPTPLLRRAAPSAEVGGGERISPSQCRLKRPWAHPVGQLRPLVLRGDVIGLLLDTLSCLGSANPTNDCPRLPTAARPLTEFSLWAPRAGRHHGGGISRGNGCLLNLPGDRGGRKLSGKTFPQPRPELVSSSYAGRGTFFFWANLAAAACARNTKLNLKGCCIVAAEPTQPPNGARSVSPANGHQLVGGVRHCPPPAPFSQSPPRPYRISLPCRRNRATRTLV